MAINKRVKDGRTTGWQVIVYVGQGRSDRRARTIGTFKTKREAQSAERKALEQLERGTFVDPSVATIADALTLFLSAKAEHVTANTLVDYRIAADKHIAPALGSVRIQRLTPARIEVQYRTWREGGMSRRMVQRCHLVLAQAMDAAVRHGLVHRNVVREVKPPSVERTSMQVWSPEETSAFLEVARHDTWAPLWFLLALEGMRRGEALGLRWSDVTWERGTAHISQTVIHDRVQGAAAIRATTKTKAGARTVRLTRQTLDVLAKERDRQRFGGVYRADGLVLSTRHGTPINPANVVRSYDRLVIISGVPRIRVHDLRHTCASSMLRLGVPAKVVQEKLGHASIAVTMDTYSHVAPSMQDEAAEKLSDLMDTMVGGH